MALTKVIGSGLGAVTQDGAATFNEGSADVDFRVESNGNANALIVDGGHSTVGINTAAVSNRTLKIEGEGNTGAILSLNESTRGGLVEFSAGSGTELYIGSELGILGSGNNNEFLIHTGVSALKIDRTGAISKPKQPAFSVRPTSNINNIAVGSDVTIAMATEIFDQNSDYNNSTYTFTAPVSGKYRFDYAIRAQDVDTASSYYLSRLNTSNRNYDITIDTDEYNSDLEYLAFSNSVLADMDSGDTAILKIYQDAGTSQTDINANNTRFSGNLVA